MVGRSMILNNPKLEGVNPFDPELTLEQKGMILEECRVNADYFYQACLKLTPAQSKNYENFVREILVTLQHQLRYPEQRKPIYIYIRRENMLHFMTEFKAQASVVYPELTFDHWGTFEAWWQKCGLNVVVSYQILFNEANNYVRYTAKADSVIYADYN
ncbi:hypothetical protein FDI21_gp119 [Pseudomonas phage Noxifer]|uniref:Uncharacterized protein n=1 Tax=Pseudomonas phage Noxifer TaxID=2006684 RepID=A0A1Y0T187_9CAUD|nr:hypothetical protein FDI21_gp119 [Pseudomonas phage Noxifer]ARV77288.1 hypothetical protein NOXIFER_119 [Pseudomonas phage Noxifer]